MDKLERGAKTLKSRQFTRIIKNSSSKLDDVERLKKFYYDPKERGSFGGVKRLTEASDPNKDFLITHKPQGFSVTKSYLTPNKEIFKNQETKLIARESILDNTCEVKLEERNLLQQINSKLLEVGLNDVKFWESNGQIIVTLPFNVNIVFKLDSCPKLRTALNIIDDAYVIRVEQLKIQFLYTRPASSVKDELFNVFVYKVFSTTRK
ncbi:uncharacterized protein TNCV_4085061 [Trichonephila clavipes]|nr:uncharacterized protein TNCV_4085061 [Trichonephila clavipes]